MSLEPSMRRIVYAKTSAQRTHIDDVMAKVWFALFKRLTSGPLEGSVPAYLRTVTKRMACQHLEELRQRAEHFVGDATHQLEDPSAHISVSPASKVELQQVMPVLRDELSELQLKAFVLNEAYGLQAPTIAELLGGGTTKASVRDALRHARRKLRSERVGVRLGIPARE
ncbi:RNA polymerase sigma factor [Streptomyces sp. NPDC054784]